MTARRWADDRLMTEAHPPAGIIGMMSLLGSGRSQLSKAIAPAMLGSAEKSDTQG